jgi:hypothetical protein
VKHSTRRAFLRGAGTVAIGLPFLPSLARTAGAQPGVAPKRLVCIFTHNQQWREFWLPTGGETDFTLSPVLAPLAPFRDKLLVLHNLASDYHDHGAGTRSTLTESDGDGPSIDQLVAQRLGNATRIRSLELATQSYGESVCFSGPQLMVPPMEHPRSAFDRVVGAVNLDPASQARLGAQRASVLDAVMARYESVSRRITAGERRLVDAHLTELRALEMRVTSPAMVRACGVPPAPAIAPGAGALRDESLFPEVCRAQIDNLVTALSCDVTRVASLMISKGGSMTRYRWLPEPLDDVAHDVAHGFINESGADIPDAHAKWATIQTWHAEQIAYLLERLDAVEEGEGTLLDHTVVAWVSELGLATGSDGHRRSNMPVVLAGGCRGYFRTGRFLDLGGARYADLLLTLGHAMGFEDITSFGTTGTGPLETLRA